VQQKTESAKEKLGPALPIRFLNGWRPAGGPEVDNHFLLHKE
jgi:hypothetical protein